MSNSEDWRPDAFKGAISGAVKIVKHLSDTECLDEETLTGAILGALSTAFAYEAEVRDQTHHHNSGQFSWARYNKGSANNKESEAYNGADFALVLVDAEGKAKIAISQAKRGKAVRPKTEGRFWSIETFHLTNNSKGVAVPQIEALTRSAQAIQQADTSPRPVSEPMIHRFYKNHPSVDGLTWVHYLAYIKGSALCFPLSDMSNLLEKSMKPGVSSAKFEFDPSSKESNYVSIFDVLEDGISAEPKHWLPLKYDESIEALPTLIDLMPVYFSGHLSKFRLHLGRALNPKVSSHEHR